MRSVLVFLASLTMMAILTLAGNAATENGKRVALVIGNGKYTHALPLPNPAADARLISATLRDAGFEVVEGFDLDKTAMIGTIDRFTEEAYDAEVALVYYSGHGMQVEGINFLIPVDAELTAPAHLRTRTIQVDDILAALPSDPAIGVIILDACRDNPLSRSLAAALPATRSTSVGTGLAAVQAIATGTGTGGTLIAYATDPGSVALDGKGANSPYTTALAKYIAAPGIELQSALTRVRGEVTEATLGKQKPWHNASLGREVYLGGRPTESTAAPALIVGEPEPAQQARSGPDSWEIEQRLWDEASKRNSIAHYDAYLEQFPNGRFATVAKLNIDQLKADEAKPVEMAKADAAAATDASGSALRTGMTVPEAVKALPGTEITEASIGLDRAARIDIQLRLGALGFDLGTADGSLGPRSRRAIGDWQTRHGMVSSTFLTPDQHAFLKVETEPMMAAVRAQHEAGLAAERQRQIQRKQDARKQEQAQKKKVAQKQTTQKKQRQQRVVEDDGPPEKLGRVEDDAGNDALGKVLLFGTGVAVGTIIKKNH